MFRHLRLVTLVGSACLAGMLAGCVYYPYPHPGYAYAPQPVPGYAGYPDQRGVEFGTVSYIEGLQAPNRTTGLGVILGAVVGGVLGNHIGGGAGRAATTAIGAVGGAVAGNAIEGRGAPPAYAAFRITVQLDQGGQRVYQVPSPGALRPGDRVRLYEGQISRL